MTLKFGSEVTQGHQTDMDRSSIHDFLLTLHSNHQPMSYHFSDKRRFQSKIGSKFPRVFHALRWRDFPWHWASKTRMMGLPGWGRCLTTSSTSCARGDTIWLRPWKLTISSHLFTRWRCCSGITIYSYLFARWHLFRHLGYLRHQQQVDFWPFNIQSGVWVTCDVGYLCANISLPGPLCSRVTPDERDRQTDVRQKHRLMPPPYGGGCIAIHERDRRTDRRTDGQTPAGIKTALTHSVAR